MSTLLQHLSGKCRLACLVLLCGVPFFFGYSVSAQEKLKYSDGLLWKVEKEGQKENYLFGVLFVPDREVVELPEAVEKALLASTTVAFPFVAGVKEKLPRSGGFRLTDGRTLDLILGVDMTARVVEMAREMKIPKRIIKTVKPWALYFILRYTRTQRILIKAGRPLMHKYMMRKAHSAGAQLKPLERTGEQHFVFDMLPDADQIKLVEMALENFENSEIMMQQGIKKYLARDVNGLMADYRKNIAVMSPDSTKLIQDEFVVRRNERMVDEAMKLMEKYGTVFMGVGLVHLPGEGGMLDLFVKEGYTVTMVY